MKIARGHFSFEDMKSEALSRTHSGSNRLKMLNHFMKYNSSKTLFSRISVSSSIRWQFNLQSCELIIRFYEWDTGWKWQNVSDSRRFIYLQPRKVEEKIQLTFIKQSTWADWYHLRRWNYFPPTQQVLKTIQTTDRLPKSAINLKWGLL